MIIQSPNALTWKKKQLQITLHLVQLLTEPYAYLTDG